MPAAVSTPVLVSARYAAAMEIVRVHTAFSAAAHFVPLPVVNSLIIGGIHVQMAEALAHHYGQKFAYQRKLVFFNAAGVGVTHAIVTRAPSTQFLKITSLRLPVFGAALRVATWPAVVAAFTYTLGKSYVEHYESGGRPDTFHPEGLLATPLAKVAP